MVARIMGAVDRAEVEKKSARQKLANKQRAKNGKPWVQRSFGYDGNAIVPAEAAAIRKACRALLNGATLWSIAKEWNAKGITTVKGYQWEGSKVRQVLLRPRNAGLQIYDGEILDGVEAAWKPIVDRDTWEAVRKTLADPKRFTGRSMGRKHLLSGIAYCGECERRMGTMCSKTKSGANRPVYQCKNIGLHEDRAGPRPHRRARRRRHHRAAGRPRRGAHAGQPTVDAERCTSQIATLRALITATARNTTRG